MKQTPFQDLVGAISYRFFEIAAILIMAFCISDPILNSVETWWKTEANGEIVHRGVQITMGDSFRGNHEQ
jgi:hypothetical protein